MLLPKDDITLHPCNPLVHFCLVNGSDQSPSLRSYNVSDYDEMIEQQTQQYLFDYVELRQEFNQVFKVTNLCL